jgi:hypothetical protein
VAQWLHDLGGVNVNIEDEKAFRAACYEGQLAVAKWLYYYYYQHHVC